MTPNCAATARGNLRAVARRAGSVIPEWTWYSGKPDWPNAGDAVAGYSYGMWQRLGVVAVALSGPFHLASPWAMKGPVRGG
jgi:hypothetical protein